MPEGDTIARAAARLGALVGEPLEVEAPQPRHAPLRLAERLGGARLESAEARGKHLLLRFDVGLVIHIHLRMSGRIDVLPRGAPWPRARRRAWLVLRGARAEAVIFDGPVLELLDAARASLHPALSRLGGDVLDAGFDAAAAVARARRGDAHRPVADVLLDQRVLAGVGNVWKCEALFARGIAPATALGAVPDDELEALLATAAQMMRAHVASGARRRPTQVYGRAGEPCRTCGTLLAVRRVGDDGRPTFWCPTCQPERPAPRLRDVRRHPSER